MQDSNNIASVDQQLLAKDEGQYYTLSRNFHNASLQQHSPNAINSAIPSLKRRVSSNAEEDYPKQQQSNSLVVFYNLLILS